MLGSGEKWIRSFQVGYISTWGIDQIVFVVVVIIFSDFLVVDDWIWL